MSCVSLLGFFLLAGCTPEANPAPTNPPSEPTTPPTEEPPTPEEDPVEEKQLVVEHGDRTDVLSAQMASAPFDKTYLIPEGVEVVTTGDSLTFSAAADLDLDYDFQATVSAQALPADYDLTLRRDFTSLSLRSEENEPNNIDLAVFPELLFDYYLSIDTGNDRIHRLVQFDQELEQMYVATLMLSDTASLDSDTYEEIVSLFHAILISANDEDVEIEPIPSEYASLSLTEKLQDRSLHDQANEDASEQISLLSTSYNGNEVTFPVETHLLFDSIEVELPEGYEMRTLGEQSYSFTHTADTDYEHVSLIIGLAHPNISLNLHVNALRSSGTELPAGTFPELDSYDYAFADQNDDGLYAGLTLIKELDDGRILDVAVRTGEEHIDTMTLVKLIAALATVDTTEASIK